MSHAHLLFEHCFAWISPACDPQLVSLWQQNGGTILSPFTNTNHTNTTTGQDQVQQQENQVGINDQILHQIQFFITNVDHVLPTDDNDDDEKRINRYFASRVNDASESLGTLDDSIVWIGSQWIVDCLDQHKMLNLAKYIIVPAVSQQQQQEPKEQAALPITKETDDDDNNRQRIESASEDKKQVSESEPQHKVQSVVESQEARSHVESEPRERTEETEEEDSAGEEEEYDYEAEIAAMSKRVITYAPRSTNKKRKAREESETVVVVRQTFEETVRGEEMNRIVKRMRGMDTVDKVRTTDKVRRLVK